MPCVVSLEMKGHWTMTQDVQKGLSLSTELTATWMALLVGKICIVGESAFRAIFSEAIQG